MRHLVSSPDDVTLEPSARVRVIYGDTDRMGIVYHGTYARYLEHARVEFIRGLGVTYAELERRGFGLPVIELAIGFRAPAIYDDIVTVWVGIRRLTHARLDFAYRATVEPGDRVGHGAPILLLVAESRHGCVRLEDGRATRFPDEIQEFLGRHYNP